MRHALLPAAALFLFLTAPHAGAVISYNIFDVGTLAGNSSFAAGVNATGQVTGESMTSAGVRGYLYDAGTITSLGTIANVSDVRARAINDAGQIVGELQYPNTSSTWGSGNAYTSPFIHSAGAITDLGGPGAGYLASAGAYSINNNGDVLVLAHTSSIGAARTLVYSGGNQTDIGVWTDPSFISTSGRDINDAGQITGYISTYGNSIQRAFLYDGGTLTPLGTLGGTNSQGAAINNLGEVVGYSNTTGDAAQHAFLYSNGQMTSLHSLGTASYAYDINNAGEAVGAYLLGGGGRAFVHTGGQMHDLNGLIPANTGWTLHSAWGINDAGWIAGNGTLNGQSRGFLLVPVPEPALSCMLLAGAPALLLRRRAQVR
jgi:probable HAF family extracellular repeat protein